MSRKPAVSRRAGTFLYAILASSFVLSIIFGLRVPLNGNPDETDHRDYIRLLIKNHGFVKFEPMDFATVSTDDVMRDFEVHQPPLYYLMCVPVQLASRGSVFAVRMVSAVLQLITILVVFRIVRDLFPEREGLALGAAAFVALLPTQAQLSAAISNDSLTTLVCATIFWKLGRLVQRGQPARQPALLGVLIGLGLLTKLSVLQLLPAVVVAYGIAVRTGKAPLAAAARQCVGVLALGLVIASPWLVRNQMLYGDPFALHIYSQTGPNPKPSMIMDAAGWTFADYARNVGLRSFASFWYLIDPGLSFRHFTGNPALLLSVIVFAGCGLFGVYRWFKAGSGSAIEQSVVGLALISVLFLLPFFIQFVSTVFQAQGRYFLPVLAPVAIVTCLGWSALTTDRRKGDLVMFVFLAALFALCLYQVIAVPVH